MPSLPAPLPPPVLAPDPNTVTCALCTRQFAKYTCPACNAPYCSLPCFRSLRSPVRPPLPSPQKIEVYG
ncbi:hypothetical protein DFH09DRAFT_1306771 [Mycena vulgaris]|nr:hypothetical protein DFH09DRAFT_1306771 [Mycena vulgaris]